MAHILLVEDDPVLGKGLKVALELDGHSVQWVDTLAGARAQGGIESLELVLLDLNLPDGSGLSFAQECRDNRPGLAVLMLTASGDEESVVAGFEAGAIDYVRKPFGNKELKARIRVILGRKSKPSSRILNFGDLTVFPERRQVKMGETKIDLNRREFDILLHLMTNPETVVTRECLLRALNKEGEIFDRTIDSHVSHLRSRLRKAGVNSVEIASVYGVGYRLEKKA